MRSSSFVFALISTFFYLAQAAPVMVFVTQTADDVFVTVGDPDANAFSTEWNNNVYLTTKWPEQAPAAAPTEAPAANSPAADPTPAPAPAPAPSPTPAAAAPAPAVTTSPEAVVAPTEVAPPPAPVVVTSEAPAPAPAPESTTSTTPIQAAATPVVVQSTEAPTETPTESSTTVVKTYSPDAPGTPTQIVTSTQAAPSPTQDPSGPAGVPQWIVYSPYNNDQSCKDSSTVLNDLYYIKSKGVTGIRVYATDCNSLETIQPAAKQVGLSITQGLWIGPGGFNSAQSDLQALLNYASSNGWDGIEKVILGNEDINNGYISAQDMLNNAPGIKGQLRAAGFNGNFLMADTTNVYQDNPDLANADVFDVIGLQSHSYFDPGVSAQQAGSFVQGQVGIVQDAITTGKSVWVTETGYPHQGDTNGLNVPSESNQQAAVESLISAFNGDVIILTTFDDFWKQPGPYGVEQYFGVISWLD